MKRMEQKMKERIPRLNEIMKESGYRLIYQEKVCNNIIKEGYLIEKIEESDGLGAGCVFYYNPEWYEMSDEKTCQFLLSHLSSDKLLQNFDINNLMSAKYITSNVLPMIIGKQNLKDIANSGLCYITQDDFIILYYIRITQSETGIDQEDIGHMKLTYKLIERLHITSDELHCVAFQNLNKAIEITSLYDLLKSSIPFPAPPEISQAYVVTNIYSVFGAAAILSKTAYNILSEYLGEKFLVLPSSIHECIAVPYDDHYINYADIVSTVNKEMVSIEDRLTDHVYLYDMGKLTVIA